MVVNEIKDLIDKSRDNKIDTQELLEALEPDGFFSDSENLAALWELLNNWDATWLDKELLNSLERSFYSIESSIVQKEDLTDEDVRVLQVYMTVLWEKCREESIEAQKAIDWHNMKKIMAKDRILPKDICVLENYITKPSYEERVDLEKILIVQDFLDWHAMEELMQWCLKKGRINKDEQKKIDEYMDKLWQNNNELQASEQVQRLNKIQEFQSQQDKIIQTIKSKYRGLDPNSQNLLWELLWGSWDLIPNIDKFIEWDISIKTAKEIKWINILNQIIQDDTYSHEKLQKKVDESVKDMMHPINEIIAKNTNAWDPRKNYNPAQIMSTQLWANVCHGENLTIDGKTCKYPYYLKDKSDTENNKLTSLYIYRLEFLTRKDVIEYRHNKKSGATDNLLDIPELDEILSTLSIKDQDEILMDFLNNCYLKIRQSWPSFEDKIQWNNLKILLDLAIKSKTGKDISIEDGIVSIQQLIEKLEKNWEQNEKLVESLRDEIDTLCQKDENGEYLLKNMWEYYERQYTNFKKTINAQNKNNVDISHRQHALSEWNDIQYEWIELNTNEDKNKLWHILKKLADMYNSTTTSQYKKWMEKGEVFNPYIINDIAIRFKMDLSPKERNEYGETFCQFMRKCCNNISSNINQWSNILDITHQLEREEQWEKDIFSLKPVHDINPYDPKILAQLPPYLQKDEQSIKKYIEEHHQPKTIWYELKLWHANFKGWLWVKNVYDEMKSWKLNIVITESWTLNIPWYFWYSWELCKCERKSNWDVRLRKYGKNGELPTNPTKIIKWNDIKNANIAMISALKSIDTDEFQEVANQFKGDEQTFKSIDDSISTFMEKYQNYDLSNKDLEDLKRDVWSIATLTKGLKKNLPTFRKLRNILDKMRGNWNLIKNWYEQQIDIRYKQVITLISVVENDYFGQLSKQLSTMKSNDNRWEQISRKRVILVAWAILSFVAWILSGIISFWAWAGLWAALATSLLIAVSTAEIQTVFYCIWEWIQTYNNYQQGKTKIIEDRWWNKVEIPWYVPESQQTVLYKWMNGDARFIDVYNDVALEFLKNFAIDAICGMAGNFVWSGLKAVKFSEISAEFIEYSISEGYSIVNIVYGSLGVIMPVVYAKNINATYQELCIEGKLLEMVSIFLKSLYPITDIATTGITCKSMDESWNFKMEYDSHNNNLEYIKEQYLAEGWTVENTENWLKVTYDWKTIEFESSNMPAEYRSLSEEMKTNLSELGWVEVDEETWEISYKNPDGLVSLRGLWTYLEMTGQWELYIDSDWNAKLIMQSALGTPSVINIYPQAV